MASSALLTQSQRASSPPRLARAHVVHDLHAEGKHTEALRALSSLMNECHNVHGKQSVQAVQAATAASR